MTEHWQYPVNQPIVTDALAVEIVERAKTERRKAKAFDTRLRFSDAGRCARQIGYDLVGVEPEQWDAASLHVAHVGTLYHEELQGAIERRFPGAKIEPKGQLPNLSNSGHADAQLDSSVIQAVVPWQGGNALYELKSKGTYQFDMAVGVMRKQWKRGSPKGPGLEVILQAGFNAVAHRCTTLIIGYVCFENFSVGLAARTGLRQMDRFLAEWHVPVEVWRPLVDAEIGRLQFILDTVDGGDLPEREVYSDDWEPVVIAPDDGRKTPWQCDYCPFRARCEEDGPGTPAIPVELRSAD